MVVIDLTKLGRNADLEQHFAPHQAKGLHPARVAVEDEPHFFRVSTAETELLAQITGHCLHEAHRADSNLPKVRDWVDAKLVAKKGLPRFAIQSGMSNGGVNFWRWPGLIGRP